jgi:BASS family bile acid:Na+ symporter
MTLVEIIPLAIKVSILTLVFALGLKSQPSDLTLLARRLSQLVRSLLSINMIMPVIAAIIVRLLHLHPPVGIMIVALALAPLPPILPGKSVKAGGDAVYAISLLVTAALFAIVSIPLSVEVVGRFFGQSLHVGPLPILKLLLVTVILPLLAGLTVRRFLPTIAARVSDPLSKIGTLLLALAGLAVLLGAYQGMIAQIGDGTLWALAAFVVAGLVVGHLLGGPDPDDRTVLAISTASRHPGVALALIHMTFPDAKAVLPVLLLYLIVNFIVGAPYIFWRKKRGAKLPAV